MIAQSIKSAVQKIAKSCVSWLVVSAPLKNISQWEG